MVNTLQTTFPDGTIQLRKGDIVWRGWSSGATRVRTQTEQGLVSGYDGIIRYEITDKTPDVRAGDKIEIKQSDDADFVVTRVSLTRRTFGMMRINLAAEFE